MTNLLLYTAPGAWAEIMSTELNSLAQGSFALSATAISQTSGYPYEDLSVILSGTTVVGGYIGIYVLPVDETGAVYGDGTASGTTLPSPNYLWRTYVWSAALSSTTISAQIPRLLRPSRGYKYGLSNFTGNALAASGSTVYRSEYTDNLNG